MTTTEICLLARAIPGMIVIAILLCFLGRGERGRENHTGFGAPAPDLRLNLDALAP